VRVVGRRSHRRSPCTPLPSQPPRPVLADLRGRCFNCFSPSHRAADCGSLVRCFHAVCLGIGCARVHVGRRLHITQRGCWCGVPFPGRPSQRRFLSALWMVVRGSAVMVMERIRRSALAVVRGTRKWTWRFWAHLVRSHLWHHHHCLRWCPPRSHILRRSRLLDQAEEDFYRALIINVLG
jgi:hypothetical protein